MTEEDEDDEDGNGIRFVTLESRFENKETVLNLPYLLRCSLGKIFNLMIY